MILVPLVVLPALALGLGYVRLLHGPVSLKFLTRAIERGIEAELPGLGARIDDALVELADGRVALKLLNLKLLDSSGDAVASAPSARVELSPVALRAFRVAPSRIELIAPRLSVLMDDDGRVSLSFAHPAADDSSADSRMQDQDRPAPARPALEPAAPAVSPPPLTATPLHGFNLVRTLNEFAGHARGAASYLHVVGVKDATVVFEKGDHHSQWLVPEIAIDLARKGSADSVSGTAIVASDHGPWSLAFRTETGTSRLLIIKTSVTGLVPAALADLPGLGPLKVFGMPIAGTSSFQTTDEGGIANAELTLEMKPGPVDRAGSSAAPLGLQAGLLAMSYDGAAHRLTLKPSVIVAANTRVTLVGEAVAEGSALNRVWRFLVQSRDGSFSLDDSATSPRVPLEALTVMGHYAPQPGLITLDSLAMKAGGGEIGIKGELRTGAKAGARLEGTIGPMPVSTLAAIWPPALATGARTWVISHVQGAMRTGTWSWIYGDEFMEQLPAAGPSAYRLAMALEAADVKLNLGSNFPPIEAPRALARVENNVLEVTVPDAAFVASLNRRVPIKGARFASSNAEAEIPTGELTFRIQSALGPILDLLDRPPVELSKQIGVATASLDGKIDGQFKVEMQLGDQPLSPKVEGKARLTEGRAKFAPGLDAQGATIAIDISPTAIEAKGELLVNAVPAQITWQRIFDAPTDRQPPLRVTAMLDAADRTQLGLDVNHLIRGDVPVEITVTRAPGSEPAVHLRAELTGAELVVDPIAWHKPPGRTAYLQCDIVKNAARKIELQNFKIAGDDIAIEGTATFGADIRMTEFSFPVFALNVVSRLEVAGAVHNDILHVTAKGATFDGRDIFRNLFTVGPDKTVKALHPNAGIDFDGDIGTVIGFSETAIRGVKIHLSERADKLSALDVKGTLEGGKPAAAMLQNKPPAPRKLMADAADAGQAFKLTGFYPNMQGGRARLEVDIDGHGTAEKTGVLFVDAFRILGDPIVSEVVTVGDASRSTPDGRPGEHRGKGTVTREVFDFDRMRAPFLIGHGQFVLQEAYLRGPLVGASLHGKVDYNQKRVDIAGTYIPLQGLNNVLGEIPVLGDLLSGPRHDGISGITFAIQGPMTQPQVIVNPLSGLAPGILRELFQLSNPDTQVSPGQTKRAPTPPEKRVRNSAMPMAAPPPQMPGANPIPRKTPETIDGWSSQPSVQPR